jgi:hypothetical protein
MAAMANRQSEDGNWKGIVLQVLSVIRFTDTLLSRQNYKLPRQLAEIGTKNTSLASFLPIFYCLYAQKIFDFLCDDKGRTIRKVMGGGGGGPFPTCTIIF